MNRCSNCKGKNLENGLINYPINWGGYNMLLKGVQVIKCKECNEEFMKSGTVRICQKIVKYFSQKEDLNNIKELNIYDVLNFVKTRDYKDCLIDNLYKGIILPKK